MKIRLEDPSRDMPGFARLWNLTPEEPLTPEQHAAFRARTPKDVPRRYYVVENDAGELVATGGCRRMGDVDPAPFFLVLIVDPACRRQGLASQLLARLIDYAKEHHALSFTAGDRGLETGTAAFAARHGFERGQEMHEMRLLLSDYDAATHEAPIADFEHEGLRFASFAEWGDTPAHRDAAYALCARCAKDNPLHDPESRFDRPSWERSFIDSPLARLAGMTLVLQNDQPVALSNIEHIDEKTARIGFTGVDRAFRGRGLARAVKAATMRWVAAEGYHEVVTATATANAPMIAANQRLGYVCYDRSVLWRLRLAPAQAEGEQQ